MDGYGELVVDMGFLRKKNEVITFLIICTHTHIYLSIYLYGNITANMNRNMIGSMNGNMNEDNRDV